MVNKSGLLLFKKEFQQNIILYLLPAPFVLAWLYLRLFSASLLPLWTGSLFGIALPFTLAIAYGLQAFDIEEDAQTRDFLLVKPLSVGRIVGEKFVIGLSFILIWTLLLLWGTSDGFFLPSIYSVTSWVPIFVLFGMILIYSSSFITSLWITGPKKLIAAASVSLLGLAWGLLSFSGIITFTLLNSFLAAYPFIQESIFYLTGSILVLVFIGMQLTIATWLLSQRPKLVDIPKLSKFISAFILFPILAVALNFATHPLVRPTRFVGLELLGLAQPFWAVDGVWQPKGDQIAFIGANNSIGMGRLGEEPRVLYQGKDGQNLTINNLSWSPDGQLLSFIDQGQVHILNPENHKTFWVGKGNGACWSLTSKQLLFSSESVPPRQLDAQYGNQIIYTIDFHRADLQKNTVEPSRQIQAMGSIWYWDSKTDSFLVYNHLGLLTIYHSGMPVVINLFGFLNKKEVAIWGRFYNQPDRPGHCFLILYSVKVPYQGNLHGSHVRFYDIDVGAMTVKNIAVLTKNEKTNLIFNPSNGTCLWGKGSTYTRTKIHLPKEARP